MGASIDTITASQFIKDPEAIVSAANKFKLGFFSPVNSTNRFVGIWYSNISVTTPIWVANRNKPLNDSSGIFTVSEDGNLVVLNVQREILWSSNISTGFVNSSAQLTDDGNLVLRGGPNGNSLWESFQQPGNTFLPGMKLSTNPKTGQKIQLSSWRSPSDPSIGSLSAGMNPRSIPEFFVFVGVPDMSSAYLSGFNVVIEGDGTIAVNFINPDNSVLINVVVSEGMLTQQGWNYSMAAWDNQWQIPKSDCDPYGKCGSFGICDARNSPICSCLKGFEPGNAEEWSKGNWTSGCIRSRLLGCYRIENGSEREKEDGFLKLDTAKVPDFGEWSSSSSEQECRNECLSNCSCVAYAYYTSFGCILWRGNLIDMQKFSYGGSDLYIRVPYSELGNRSKKKRIIIVLIVIVGAIVVASVKIGKISVAIQEELPIVPDRKMNVENIYRDKLQELPLFNLETLATATNNFHESNKLGQGGFGPQDGEPIAVKRLSRASRQGLEEFMNEVFVISKLQHRNLVKLLGCCVEGEENMLTLEWPGFLEEMKLKATQQDGYMAPEYTMKGQFSEKSDVFSFGVLLLEIVSGRRNTSFYDNAQALSLIGFAWKLWHEGKVKDLVDPVIFDPCFLEEIHRCIHVGLLCVQEYAEDRPSVPIIISMLNSEVTVLPAPKQVAFVERKHQTDADYFQQSKQRHSLNEVTLTDRDGTFALTFINPEDSVLINLVVSEGMLTQPAWNYDKSVWDNEWQIPESDCDAYGKCGSFGICDAHKSPICSCLKGFEPENAVEWSKGNWTSGCIRSRLLGCNRIENGSEGAKEDGFLKLDTVKVPDHGEWFSSSSEQKCRNKSSLTEGQIYTFAYHIQNLRVIIGLIVIVGSIVVSSVVFISWRWISRHGGIRKWKVKIGKILVAIEEKHPVVLDRKMNAENKYRNKLHELPLFNLETVATATNNFHESNKLGKGSFGPVYKGTMPDGEPIAVKTLSRASRQGLEEFMNEVSVISKLQHRNLVRLLGCCVEGEENMLTLKWPGFLEEKKLKETLQDGYMAPEYAMKGQFSEKSDVFSFGVLLLEIVSGRKNTSFYDNAQALSLLGFAWKLWNEGKVKDLVDPVIFDPCFQEEIHRCIHVGLLCVQEYAEDRPAVPIIISMLNSEITELPAPKQVGFVERKHQTDADYFQQSKQRYSLNEVTLTDVAGR
ncbi:hypothetical protein Tsubulata_029928 [Turnera subulata]|uniref:non-specific serine/threonine protein kinase n=1 Tax=Turnera subulata TaxID=218843 RepID=A0A9Q0FMY4_9ROSI|nr:hypothetical protein Tsubulata_029928 [Turnera subulata]